MSDEDYFAVINDHQLKSSSGLAAALCRDGAGNPLIVQEKEDALYLRDKHRDADDNPDINVYRITLHEESIERDEVEA